MTTERSVIARFKGDLSDLRTATRSAGTSVRETRRELESAARSGHDLARGADDATSSVKAVGRAAVPATGEVKALTGAADDAGDELRQMARAADDAGDELGQLGTKATTTTAKMKALSLADDLTKLKQRGDLYVREFDTLKLIAGERERLKKIEAEAEKAAKAGAGAVDGATRAATSVATSMSSVSPALMNPYVVAIGAAIVTLLLPLIGASIAAAVAGTIGAGGIIGGVMLAAHDNRVREAFGGMGKNILQDLQRLAGQSFVDPLVAGAHRFEEAWSEIDIDVEGVFGDLATEIGPLIDGLIGFAREAMPGVREAVKGALPVLQTLARELPQLGHALGVMLSLIGKSGPGAAAAFSIAMKVLGSVLIQVGMFAYSMSTALNGMITAFAAVTHWLASLPPAALAALGPAAQALATADASTQKWKKSLDDTGPALGATTTDVRTLNTALAEENKLFDDLFGKVMGQKEADLGWADALRGVTEAINANGGSLDANTEAGSRNAHALLDAASAAERKRQADIEAAGGANASAAAVAVANQTYREHIDALIAAAIKAGANKDQVWALIGALRSIPERVTSNVDIHTTEYREYRQGERSSTGRRWGGVTEHAQTGLLSAASVFGSGQTLYAFAEPGTGGEAFVPRKGNYQRSMDILQRAASWYGASVQPASAGIDYNRLGAALARQLAPMLASIGGSTYIGEWQVRNDQLALAVRRGEQRLGRSD